MKKKTACITQLICSADLYYLSETNNSSVADKVGDQYKSTQQNVLSNFYLKDGFAFVAVPHVEVAELVTRLGDAEHEECLCLVLERHSVALWLHEHTLYFGMTSASFGTQSRLIWERVRLWRRKLL